MVDAGEERASTPMGRGSTHADPEPVVQGTSRTISLGPRRRPRSRQAAVITAGALALGVAVAACGGSSTPGAATALTTTGVPGGGGSQATGLAAYTLCMRAHGVANFSPHPTSSVGIPKRNRHHESLQQLKVTKSHFLAARKACKPLLPAGATGGGPSGALAPKAGPFYRWSGPLAHDVPGTVLRSRTIALPDVGATRPVRAAQLLYVTTDELGRRTVSVATVLQPGAKAAPQAPRLVSYQAAYDALGTQCDPSYTLRLGASTAAPVLPYLAAGDTVVSADFEGEDLAFGAGQQGGYEALDAIRAAETWLGAAEASMPVGMVGYSGGSVPTEFASELAPTYAPHLDIVGVAEGGIPVDLFHNLAYVDHPASSWNWVIPVHLVGLARGFGLKHLASYLTAKGSAVVRSDETRCVGGFDGLTTAQLFKPQYRDIEKDPVLARMIDHVIMGRTGTPRGPLFMGVGLSGPTGDGVIVTKDVQGLAHTYCERKVPVELHIYTGLDHRQAAAPFLSEAQSFLAQRFENLPFHNACAGIGPGNSIAPVPVPPS